MKCCKQFLYLSIVSNGVKYTASKKGKSLQNVEMFAYMPIIKSLVSLFIITSTR